MTQQTLNRYLAAKAKRHRQSRFISPPDACINVTQKLCSKEESWQIFETRAQANRNLVPKDYWRAYGRHWKLRYRINVYLK